MTLEEAIRWAKNHCAIIDFFPTERTITCSKITVRMKSYVSWTPDSFISAIEEIKRRTEYNEQVDI